MVYKNYSLILSYNNNEKVLRIPFLPSEIEIKISTKNDSINVLNLGEVTQINPTGLFTLEINSWFFSKNTQYNPDLKTASEFIKELDFFNNVGKPLRIIYVGNFGINSPCTIEEFTFKEDVQNRDKISYKLSIKEYRFSHPLQLQKDKDGYFTVQKEERPDLSIKPQKIIANMDIMDIAKKYYGDSKYYIDIMRYNGLSKLDVQLKTYLGKELLLL